MPKCIIFRRLYRKIKLCYYLYMYIVWFYEKINNNMIFWLCYNIFKKLICLNRNGIGWIFQNVVHNYLKIIIVQNACLIKTPFLIEIYPLPGVIRMFNFIFFYSRLINLYVYINYNFFIKSNLNIMKLK